MITMQEAELLSWKAIWMAVLNGKHHDIQRAINEHVASFPVPDQNTVRLRTIHIVRDTQRQPDEVLSRIQRASRTIRKLQQGQFRPGAQEVPNAS